MSKHPHAELMAQYAQDAMETDKPWERWQYKNDVMHDWHDCYFPIDWVDCVQYRRKPKPYEPTLLDQALELEIEAAESRINYMKSKYMPAIGTRFATDQKINDWITELDWRKSQRTTAMIEHLKQQGKL